MKLLVLGDICSRLDLLRGVLAEGRLARVNAILIVGNLVAAHQKQLKEQYLAVFELLSQARLPVYIVPGAQDQPLTTLIDAVHHYRSSLPLVVVHRAAVMHNTTTTVAGFGGLLSDQRGIADVTAPELISPEWEARAAFEHLAMFNLAFEAATRRIFLFGVPPDGIGYAVIGHQTINRLIRSYQPALVCCGGAGSAGIVQHMNGALVVCPGQLTEGAYAIVDLEQKLARLEVLDLTHPIPAGRFKTIIVALDGSIEAWGALEMAMDMAAVTKSQLLLVHAFAPTNSLLGSAEVDEAIPRLSAGEHLLQTAIDHYPQVDMEPLLIEGNAAEVILQVAELRRADLIVMGCRGLNRLSAMLGSVSHRILLQAPCPVMIIRQGPLDETLLPLELQQQLSSH